MDSFPASEVSRTLIISPLPNNKFLASVDSAYNRNHQKAKSNLDYEFAAATVEELAKLTATAYQSKHEKYWQKSPDLFITVLGVNCGKIVRISNPGEVPLKFVQGYKTFNSAIEAITTVIIDRAEEIRKVFTLKQENYNSNKSSSAKWEFWDSLLRMSKPKTSLFAKCKGSNNPYIRTSSLVKGISYEYYINQKSVQVRLYIDHETPFGKDENHQTLSYLETFKDEIELQFGDKLEWSSFTDADYTSISKTYDTGGYNKPETWQKLQGEMIDGMDRFFSAINPYVLTLKDVDFKKNFPQDILIENFLPDLIDTDETIGRYKYRKGQQFLSKMVREYYGSQCCFPNCEINEDTFLIASHIARWADVKELRGKFKNVLCLCLMHDRAFEEGFFTLTERLTIAGNSKNLKLSASLWYKKFILTYQDKPIAKSKYPPDIEVLAHHWKRIDFYPNSKL